MISMETKADAFYFRIPRDEMEAEEAERLLRWLRLEAVARVNEVTEAEADALAEEIKADWWAKNKHRFIPQELPANP